MTMVVFPGMSITLATAVGKDERVVLVPRHEQDFAEIGVVATLPTGSSSRVGQAVSVDAEHRALVGAAQTGPRTATCSSRSMSARTDVPTDGRTP